MPKSNFREKIEMSTGTAILSIEREGFNMVSKDEDNRFQDTVIEDIGEIEISNTQKYRVLVVLDDASGAKKLSVQKWWRKGADSPWVAGKGFKLSKRESMLLSGLIKEGGLVL